MFYQSDNVSSTESLSSYDMMMKKLRNENPDLSLSICTVDGQRCSFGSEGKASRNRFYFSITQKNLEWSNLDTGFNNSICCQNFFSGTSCFLKKEFLTVGNLLFGDEVGYEAGMRASIF